jgi:hypothetical protein
MIREMARHRDSCAKERGPLSQHRECDSRGDNEFARDANALRPLRGRSTPAPLRLPLRSESGRGRSYLRRPPTPPYMRFRIRRFMKRAGGAAPYRAATPAPDDRTRTLGKQRSCATRPHSTTDHAGCTRNAMPAPPSVPAASNCAPSRRDIVKSCVWGFDQAAIF